MPVRCREIVVLAEDRGRVSNDFIASINVRERRILGQPAASSRRNSAGVLECTRQTAEHGFVEAVDTIGVVISGSFASGKRHDAEFPLANFRSEPHSIRRFFGRIHHVIVKSG